MDFFLFAPVYARLHYREHQEGSSCGDTESELYAGMRDRKHEGARDSFFRTFFRSNYVDEGIRILDDDIPSFFAFFTGFSLRLLSCVDAAGS